MMIDPEGRKDLFHMLYERFPQPALDQLIVVSCKILPATQKLIDFLDLQFCLQCSGVLPEQGAPHVQTHQVSSGQISLLRSQMHKAVLNGSLSTPAQNQQCYHGKS
jgi:hypothetical protein